MKNTKIQWCDDTVNPTSGCQGCELWIPGKGGPCYAGNFHEVRLAKSLPLLYAPTFDEVRMIPGRMATTARCEDYTGRDRPTKPWLNSLRRKIFVGDLGDIFSKAVTDEFLTQEIVATARSIQGIRHDWLLLTKQPLRAAKFTDTIDNWPTNLWIGTSITGVASKTRIDRLKKTAATTKYLSVEPLVEDPKLTTSDLDSIDWVIIGGESDQGEYRGREFNPRWAADTIRLCSDLGIACFIKQMGSNPTGLSLSNKHGEDWEEWPEELRVRQMPDAYATVTGGTR